MSYFNNNAEGGSPGSTVAANQTGSGDVFDLVGFNNSATATYDNSVSIHGEQSYNITTTTGADNYYMEFQGANSLSAAVRLYIYLKEYPSGPIQIVQIRNNTTSCSSVNLSASFRPQLNNTSGTSIFTYSQTMLLGVWYRIELGITVATSTTGSGTFAYYIGDSTTPVETVYTFTTANLGTANATKARFGKVTQTAASTNFYLDDLTFTDDSSSLIGPYPLMVPSPWFSA